MECLYSSGLCHYDLKIDNVLINEEDRAVLCDFSSLNYTENPLKSITSPLVFRPPECFSSVASQNEQEVPHDAYTFEWMALNRLTSHFTQMEWMEKADGNWNW